LTKPIVKKAEILKEAEILKKAEETTKGLGYSCPYGCQEDTDEFEIEKLIEHLR